MSPEQRSVDDIASKTASTLLPPQWVENRNRIVQLLQVSLLLQLKCVGLCTTHNIIKENPNNIVCWKVASLPNILLIVLWQSVDASAARREDCQATDDIVQVEELRQAALCRENVCILAH